MYQKDYILRMLEMLADMIAHLLGLMKKGDHQQANIMLERAYHDFLKEDAAFFRVIPAEKLVSTLLNEHNYNNGHLEILSELFYVQAELYYSQGKKKHSAEFYHKSLILFNFIVEESKTYSDEKQIKLNKIKDRIEELKNFS